MITKNQKDILLKALESGMNKKDSCTLAHLSQDWFYNEIKEDPNFAQLVDLAAMKLKRQSVARIKKASQKDWKAASWLLERKWSDEFSPSQRHEHTGDMMSPIAKLLAESFKSESPE